jgi:ABC-type antimicrobial peptide transport system permease subunit
VAVTTAALFGTVPALRAARSDANEALRDSRGLPGSGRRVAVLVLVGLPAGAVPARRAARVDPTTALRSM